MDALDANAQSRAWLLAIYQRYIAGGPEAIYETLHPDIVWTSGGGELPWGGTRRGLGGVQAYFAALLAEVELTDWVLERVLAEGEWMVAMVSLRIRFRRTGAEYRLRKVDTVRVRGGRVLEYQEFYDSAAVLSAWKAQAPPP